MDIRTDRAGVLIEQLTDAADLSRARCEGLTDDELRWEPLDGMWSVRARGQAATSAPFGPGPWVLDRELGDPFAPGPVSTIAWRVAHLTHCLAGRHEWTFGPRQTDPADVVAFTPVADEAMTALWDEVDRWAGALDTLTEAQLDEVGLSQYSWGLDPQLPFIGIVRWVNRELIHHLAEVALLRDLYAQRHQLS